MRVLADLSRRLQTTHDPALLAEVTQVVELRPPSAPWRDWAAHAYRIWLRQFSDRAGDDRLAEARRQPTSSIP
jgi:hypothetical protein